MAQTIKLKRSATPGGVPTTSALALGEVAINTADGKMYIKKDVGGTESIVEIGSGGGGSLDVIWKQYVYTAGVAQTVFTGADDNSDILAYAVNFIEVYLNGILLDPSVDFTATDNTSIVFTEAPATGDLIQIDTFAKSVGIGDILLNSFTGDNSTTIFTLSDAPGDENNTSVFIGGVYQNKTTYSVSGTSLTFSEAPATNAEIEVVIGSRNVSLTDIADLSISGVLTASGGNSTNWNTAYGWGDHSTAGYLPLTGGTLSGSLSLGFNDITSVGTITATQFSGELFGNVTGNVLGNVTGDVTGSAGTVTSLAGHTTTELTEGTNLYYTDARADARVALIVDSAPVTLDTLNELAAALGDDPNFATTTATAIGLKAPLDSPTFTGPVVFNSTGSIKVPVGTTAERDVIPTSGMFRYNSSEAQFEGYQDGSWGAIGGGGGGSNTFTTDSFIGDGSTTDYVLSQTISSEDNLLVFIEGVFQQQDAYSIATVAGVTTLTFTVAPIDTRDIIIYSVAGAVSGSNLNIDTMIGDNTTTDLILSIAPINENNTQVFLDGVYQNKSTYSISGTTLTFSTAPPTDTEVEVMTFTQTDINVPVDNTITTAKLVDGSVTSAKLDTNIAVASLVATTADINAGTIDGTTIGATTPASVAATTLSTTGAATFSAGITATTGTFSGNVNSTAAGQNLFSNVGNVSLAVQSNATDKISIGVEQGVGGTFVASGGALKFRVGGYTAAFDKAQIDASGNLFCSGGSGGTILTLTASSGTTSGDIGRIRFGNRDIDSNLANIVGYQDGATNSGGLKFETQPAGGATVERMRIDSSGNVGVGVTPNAWASGWNSVQTRAASLYSQNAGAGGVQFNSYYDGQWRTQAAGYGGVMQYDAATGFLGFYNSTAATGGAGLAYALSGARMALDGSGRLLINTASILDGTNAKLQVLQDVPDHWSTRINNSTDNPFGLAISYKGAAPNNTINHWLYFVDTLALRFGVRSNGGIENYQANDVNLSDEREKNQFGLLDSTTDCVRSWDIVKYLYKDEDQTNPHKYGVIAQQVAEHCPEVISNWVKVQGVDEVLWAEEDDDIPEGVSVGDVKTEAVEQVDRIGVKEQQMFWMLVKSHQEALDTIDALTARLEALEGA